MESCRISEMLKILGATLQFIENFDLYTHFSQSMSMFIQSCTRTSLSAINYSTFVLHTVTIYLIRSAFQSLECE